MFYEYTQEIFIGEYAIGLLRMDKGGNCSGLNSYLVYWREI